MQFRTCAELPLRQIFSNRPMQANAACSFAIGSVIPLLIALCPHYMREMLGASVTQVSESYAFPGDFFVISSWERARKA